METLIQEPQLKQLKRIAMHPRIGRQTGTTAEVLRIQADAECTRIDFIVRASRKYINGGWVCMDRNAFIRPAGTGERMLLLQAVNIPVAPAKHYFRDLKDMLCYTLIFPPLPKSVLAIDIIEAEGPGGNWFNFYGVSMTKVRSQVIAVPVNN